MAEIILDLAAGFYTNQSEALAGQQCVNLIPKIMEAPGTKNPTALYSTGLVTFTDTLSGPGRGWLIFQGELHSVQGTNFVKIDSNGVITVLGVVAGTSRCFLAENGETVAITDPDGASYFYGTDIGVLEINQTNFGASGLVFEGYGQVTSVVEKDSFFIFTNNDLFFISRPVTVNKGREFDALDFGTAEISTDQVVSALVVRNELHITGTRTIELYQEVDTPDFPYQRINGAHVEKGVFGRYSVIDFNNTYAYIGGSAFESPSIWLGTSGSAVKISNDAIDTLLKNYSDEQLKQVLGWTYSFNGHFFAGWNLPDTTIVYDATSTQQSGRSLWHERKTAGSTWIPNNFINVYGKILCQNSVDGKIGQVSDSVYSEFDSPVNRFFVTGYTHNQGKRILIKSIELFYEQGTAELPSTKDIVSLEISFDGGKKYQSRGLRNLGLPGDTSKRVVWRQQGLVEDDFKLRFSTTSKQKLIFEKVVMNVNPTG